MDSIIESKDPCFIPIQFYGFEFGNRFGVEKTCSWCVVWEISRHKQDLSALPRFRGWRDFCLRSRGMDFNQAHHPTCSNLLTDGHLDGRMTPAIVCWSHCRWWVVSGMDRLCDYPLSTTSCCLVDQVSWIQGDNFETKQKYNPVIKHGWLENGPYISDFPS